MVPIPTNHLPSGGRFWYGPRRRSRALSPLQGIVVRGAEQKRHECERQWQTPEDYSRQRQWQTPEDNSRQRRPPSPVLTTTDPQQGDESEDRPQQTKNRRRKYQAHDPEADRHPGRITEWVQAP